MSIINADDPDPPHTTTPLTRFTDAARSSGVHSAYLTAIRDGTTGHRYRVPVARGLTVTITLAASGPGRPPYDTHRERQSWQQLRRVVTNIHDSDVTCVLHPDLPREIATATWTRNGTRVRVARPGTPRHTTRPRARTRWQALTATPVIAAIAEKAGQITLGGVTAAALLAPIPPLTPPPIGPDHNHVDDVGAGHDHYPPAPPKLPAAFAPPDTTPMPMLPEPPHDATADQTPEPSPAEPVRVDVTIPAPSPRVSPTVSGPPQPVKDQDEAADAPDTSPAPTSTPSVSTPPPSGSVTPRPDRHHRPGHRHGHRQKHGHRHRRGR